MNKKLISEPKSKFIKVRCSKCKNDQIIFGKPSSQVDCLVCGKTLADPQGGKGLIKARILEVLT
jgi:small subunit ribosomal protein S27e